MAADGRTPAEWAVENERLYRAAIRRWNSGAGDWDTLLDALEHAYGAKINWLDAGNEELAERAEQARQQVRELLWGWLPATG